MWPAFSVFQTPPPAAPKRTPEEPEDEALLLHRLFAGVEPLDRTKGRMPKQRMERSAAVERQAKRGADVAQRDEDGTFLGMGMAPEIDGEARELELGYIVAAAARLATAISRGVISVVFMPIEPFPRTLMKLDIERPRRFNLGYKVYERRALFPQRMS